MKLQDIHPSILFESTLVGMSFPRDEWSDLKNRLKNKLKVYTTRVEKEQGKYKEGQMVSTPLQSKPLKIVSVKTYKKIEDHPFYEYLTPSQMRQIGNKVYDVVGLVTT